MESWLKKRLTPAKAKQARWTSLAEALEELWGSYFDPALSRLERLRSSYSADDEDLAHKLREMGDYFTYDLPKAEDRPVTLAWRRLELQNKDLEYILKSVFRRHFGHFPVYWLPLFAPKGEPYGTSFIPFEGLEDAPEKNLPPEGMFLTSRGVLGVDRAGLYAGGMDKADFSEKAFPLIKRTKPLHIVFDGCLWFIRHDLPFKSDLTLERVTDDYFSLLFSTIGGRFDITAGDEKNLDTSTLGLERETEHRHLALPFIPTDFPTGWRLDLYPPDGLPEGWLRLDTAIPGFEGMTVIPAGVVLRENGKPTALNWKMSSHGIRKETQGRGHTEFSASVKPKGEDERRLELGFFPQKSGLRLDAFHREGFPEGFLPLDLILPYTEGGLFAPLYRLHAEGRRRTFFTWTASESSARHTDRQTSAVEFYASTAVNRGSRSLVEIPHPDHLPSLDQQPLFDEIPADFMPVDYPYGGYANV